MEDLSLRNLKSLKLQSQEYLGDALSFP